MLVHPNLGIPNLHHQPSQGAQDRDYYAEMGVGSTANDRELKSAYRQAAKKYHPDVNDNPLDQVPCHCPYS